MKLGALIWPQFTDWRSVCETAALVDRIGYDSVWTWDHVYPTLGEKRGPIFEGYMTLAGLAQHTSRVTLGLMVGANTFRNPALVVKMVTTLDHMSSGRAWLGVGAGRDKTEHTTFGIEYGCTTGDRLDRLDEAVELMYGMLRGGSASARGRYYAAKDARNDPPPLQERLPILIGGRNERKTLATVARYADAWNVGGDLDSVRRKDEVLRRWCDEVGRDEKTIERTLQARTPIIRDTEAEARKVAKAMAERNGGWHGPGDQPIERMGPAEVVAEAWAPYVDLGFEHFYVDCPVPYDHETLERLAAEVRPLLEAR